MRTRSAGAGSSLLLQVATGARVGHGSGSPPTCPPLSLSRSRSPQPAARGPRPAAVPPFINPVFRESEGEWSDWDSVCVCERETLYSSAAVLPRASLLPRLSTTPHPVPLVRAPLILPWTRCGRRGFYEHPPAMPRSRGSELPQRASPRAPLHLKTTAASDSNGAHHRSVLDRSSPKVADRHSPRSPLPEKKRAGTRVAELETKLGKVQDELKKLREQLVSAEAAKKDAQVALEEAKKHVGTTKGSPSPKAAPASPPTPVALENEKEADEVKVAEPAAAAEEEEEESSINSPATDVFEVVRTESGDKENQGALVAEDDSEEVSCGDKVSLAEEVSCGDKAALAAEEDVEVEETKTMIEEASNASATATGGGVEKESLEVLELKALLTAREMEVAVLTADNAELKKLAGEAAEAARRAEEDAVAKAFLIEQELKENAAREARMGEQLRASDAAREALEGEMRRLRVQTEQWRKAAEAAAAVIGGDAHLAGHHGIAGSGNGWGSPATMPDDLDDDGFGSKRKGAGGIRMLGDLWKKKGSK
uniref:Uncharacterized protein n=1 Tax=Avena sativa TaxID=4498 RepID=A0ACD5VHS6_AVESA